MAKSVGNNREPNEVQLPLLIAAHCSTLRRKAARMDSDELLAMLNDLVREISSVQLSPKLSFYALNEIVSTFNSNFPPKLLEVHSHFFFNIIRDTLRNLLQYLSEANKLNHQEVYALRNCTVFLHSLVENTRDLAKILHWITDVAFLDALGNCLNRINKVFKATSSDHIIKQITRLLDMFCRIQDNLPIGLQENLFSPLLQPTINCFTSSDYVRLFNDLKPNASSLTPAEKLFLVKCPHFLTGYSGPHIEQAAEQVLGVMLPRYVSILDKHMITITEWKRPMMRAIHNLIITIVSAEGYFSAHINNKLFQTLITHLLNLLNQPTLIKDVRPNSNNLETLLIDAALVVFSVLVYEPNALDYIKKQKPVTIFRQLTTSPHETIALNAYMMLAYVMDDNDIKTSLDDFVGLCSTTLKLLGKTVENRYRKDLQENISREAIDRNIIQLIETLKALSQYEQIRNEVLNQDKVSFLVDIYKKLHGLSQQLLLECFWTLSFNEQIAQQLSKHPQFISSLEKITKLVENNDNTNALRRSNSYISRQNSTVIALGEGTNSGLQRAAEGLLWTLVKEQEFRKKQLEKINQQTETNKISDRQNYKYDAMISYCHADKDIVRKIYRFLTNEGFRTWYERSHKQRSAMEVVANGIENSEFTIICMSESYRRNNRCRAEAEYAFNSKRNLLPLTLRAGYKPDEWLSALVQDSKPIDFAESNFKEASKSLSEEIKRRRQQSLEQVTKTTSAKLSSINNVHDASISSTATNKPAELPSSTGSTNNTILSYSIPPVAVNTQQPVPISATTRTPTPGANSSITPNFAHAQQQQGSFHSASQSPVVNSIHNMTSAGALQPQQLQMNSVTKVSPSDGVPLATSTLFIQQRQIHVLPVAISTTGSVVDHQQPQQTSATSFSRLTSSGTVTPVMSSPIRIQTQQHQIPTNIVPSPSASNSIPVNIPIDDTQQYQQQSTSDNSLSKPLVVDPFSASRTVPIEHHQQQTQTYPILQPLSIDTNAFANTATINPQQQQQQQQIQRQSAFQSSTYGFNYTGGAIDSSKSTLPPSAHLQSGGLLTATPSATVNRGLEKQQQATIVSPNIISSKSPSVPLDHFYNVGNAQQQQKQIPNVPSLPINKTIYYEQSTHVNQKQPVSMHSIPPPPTANHVLPNTTTGVNVNQQQQQQQIVNSIIKPLTNGIATFSKQYDQTQEQSLSRSPSPGTSSSDEIMVIDKQNRKIMPLYADSQSLPPTSSSSVVIEKQQQQQGSRSHSNLRATTPATSSITPTKNSVLPMPLQAQLAEQSSLFEKYMRRNTSNSTYRTIPIHAWRSDDVLDFLFDSNLNAMMPLCESMSGKALTRLFRMCQEKPSRLYKQLNEELRLSFNGLALPIGTYTEFLIEMDGLVGTSPENISRMSPATPKIVERLIFTPNPDQKQLLSMRLNSALSKTLIMSSTQLNGTKPIEKSSEKATSNGLQVFERIDLRPASSNGKHYKLVVESVEEPDISL